MSILSAGWFFVHPRSRTTKLHGGSTRCCHSKPLGRSLRRLRRAPVEVLDMIEMLKTSSTLVDIEAGRAGQRSKEPDRAVPDAAFCPVDKFLRTVPDGWCSQRKHGPFPPDNGGYDRCGGCVWHLGWVVAIFSMLGPQL